MKPGWLLLLAIALILLLVGVVFRFRAPQASPRGSVEPANILIIQEPVSQSTAGPETTSAPERSGHSAMPPTRSGSVTCQVLDDSGRPRSGIVLWLLQHSKTPREQRLLSSLRFGSAGGSAFDDPVMQRTTDADGIAAWEGIRAGEDYYLCSPLGKALVFASNPNQGDFVTRNGMPYPNPDGVDGVSGLFAVRDGETHNEAAEHVGSCTLVGRVPQCAISSVDRRHRLQMTVMSIVDGNMAMEAQLVEGLAGDHSFAIPNITPGEKVLQIVWGDREDHYFFIQRCLELHAGENFDCGAMHTARVPARRFTVELVDHDDLVLPAERVFVNKAADQDALAHQRLYTHLRDLLEGDDPRTLLEIACETPTQESGCSLARNNVSMPVMTYIAPILGRECTLHGITDLPDRPMRVRIESILEAWGRSFALLPGYYLESNSFRTLAATAEPQKLPIKVGRTRELRVQIGNPLVTAIREACMVRLWILDPDSGRELAKISRAHGPDKRGRVSPIEHSFRLPVSVTQVRIVCNICRHDETSGCDVPGSPGLISDAILALEPTAEQVTHLPEWKGAVALSGTLVTPEGDPVPGKALGIFLELAPQAGRNRPKIDSRSSLDHLRQIATRTDSQGRFFFGALPPGSRVFYPEILKKLTPPEYDMSPLQLDDAGSVYSTVITRLHKF
ncbi:MAG: hypothetical protein RL277_1558 [Planctomycetota bacterium]|jgi:hypothetical protein